MSLNGTTWLAFIINTKSILEKTSKFVQRFFHVNNITTNIKVLAKTNILKRMFMNIKYLENRTLFLILATAPPSKKINQKQKNNTKLGTEENLPNS